MGGMLLNPQFPQEQKQLAMQVMTASQKLVKRFVERFDVENIDELVPGIEQATQMIGGMLGPGTLAQPPGLGAGPVPGAPPAGPGSDPLAGI
jgi:hypothetical protein